MDVLANNVPNNPYGLVGRQATLTVRAQELCDSRCGLPALPVPNSPYGLCGHKATLEEGEDAGLSELRSCVTEEVELGSRP